MKQCCYCKELKEETEFYRDAGRMDGLSSRCKICVDIKNKKWKEENISKIVDYRKKYYEENKERIKNKVLIGLKPFKFDKEELRKKKKNWSDSNKESKREARKRWDMKNPEKAKIIATNKNNRRRAICKNSDIDNKWLSQLKESTKACSICGEEMNNLKNNPKQYNLDHIILLSLGGTHTKNNVRYICRECNLKRGIKYARSC